ncbi:NAD(P)-dependent oxidoreductase [Prevotella sp. FD3004]|uniref:NAD(P)-dependent oxidoreductase n=1 Tax=Prevotella sp. FD3004 TaxID=1408309 RepID=UPI000559BDC3|nr:NAD(P)-dependent oxidoreductase [Prevotella sp. FD3004]
MKIGLIKETKTPVDNRVALTPEQVARMNSMYPESEIVVQSSDIRAYSDDEYRKAGVKVVEDINDCDVLFGIKEAKISSLISGKHYFFFGHIAKMQEYNRPLLQAFLHNNITFSDYEYLVDDNNVRLCAFGWWAGVVGVYYTLRGYGLKYKLFELPKPDIHFTLNDLLSNLKGIDLPVVKLLVTGKGRVSQGAQYVLKQIGANLIEESEYLSDNPVNVLSYYVANVEKLVSRKDGGDFDRKEFEEHPQYYKSDFMCWAKYTDILVSAHYWAPEAPVYLSKEDLRNCDNHIRMIGDVTCDIMGSIKSTIRPATHADPYYDYNPLTEKEDPLFTKEDDITVMAVDTCPNALPRDASNYFGEMLIPNVFEPLLKGEKIESGVIHKATIVEKGMLTERFGYLSEFSRGG